MYASYTAGLTEICSYLIVNFIFALFGLCSVAFIVVLHMLYCTSSSNTEYKQAY